MLKVFHNLKTQCSVQDQKVKTYSFSLALESSFLGFLLLNISLQQIIQLYSIVGGRMKLTESATLDALL